MSRAIPLRLAGPLALIGLAGCFNAGTARIKVIDRMEAGATPATLMKLEEEVRQKRIGRTVRQPGSSGHLALLQSAGKGHIWRPGLSPQPKPIAWTIVNGAQAMTGVPPDLWFICLTYPPSAERPRSGQRCTQADLWQLAEGVQPPAWADMK